MKISEIFKEARGSKGLTLRDVEKETGISNAYLSQLENGKISCPSFKVMVKLCELYEIPMNTFLPKRDNDTDQYTTLNFYNSMLTELEKDLLVDYARFLIFKRSHSQTPQPEQSK